MDDLDLKRDTQPLATEVGRALRRARQHRRLSQREFATAIGVSKSRMARLERDAGPQSLEMVCQVLMAAGFRLEVIEVADRGRSDTDPHNTDPHNTNRHDTNRHEGQRRADTLLDLCDAGGRRFPAHLEAHSLAYPPTYWFVRNGGWTTTKPFPKWTYDRRITPPAKRRVQP